MNKDKESVNEQNVRNKKLLLQMNADISKIERKIKYSKVTNFKNNTIKGLKISLRFGQLIMPYAIVASIITGGIKLMGGGLPFYRDELESRANITKYFDSLGNVRYEKQYKNFFEEVSNDNLLLHYNKWQQTNDGYYERTVETYALDDISQKEVLKLFEKENLNLKELFGEPTIKREIKSNLADEEKNEEPFLEAIMYSKDSNDYIMVKETFGNDMSIIAVDVFLVGCVVCIVQLVRSKASNFKFSECVRKIKEKYPPVDVETLTKKLEIKKENYNRLMR